MKIPFYIVDVFAEKKYAGKKLTLRKALLLPNLVLKIMLQKSEFSLRNMK
jgi:hypothetical protein